MPTMEIGYGKNASETRKPTSGISGVYDPTGSLNTSPFIVIMDDGPYL